MSDLKVIKNESEVAKDKKLSKAELKLTENEELAEAEVIDIDWSSIIYDGENENSRRTKNWYLGIGVNEYDISDKVIYCGSNNMFSNIVSLKKCEGEVSPEEKIVGSFNRPYKEAIIAEKTFKDEIFLERKEYGKDTKIEIVSEENLNGLGSEIDLFILYLKEGDKTSIDILKWLKTNKKKYIIMVDTGLYESKEFKKELSKNVEEIGFKHSYGVNGNSDDYFSIKNPYREGYYLKQVIITNLKRDYVGGLEIVEELNRRYKQGGTHNFFKEKEIFNVAITYAREYRIINKLDHIKSKKGFESLLKYVDFKLKEKYKE